MKNRDFKLGDLSGLGGKGDIGGLVGDDGPLGWPLPHKPMAVVNFVLADFRPRATQTFRAFTKMFSKEYSWPNRRLMSSLFNTNTFRPAHAIAAANLITAGWRCNHKHARIITRCSHKINFARLKKTEVESFFSRQRLMTDKHYKIRFLIIRELFSSFSLIRRH